jgi:hypothetical protein
MTVRRAPGLLLLWTVVLLAPVAWTVALGTMFPLTDFVCEHGPHTPLWAVGGLCLVLVLAGIAIGWARLRDTQEANATETAAQRSRFLLELGVGMGALFALVIAFYIVPVFLLSACPT